MGRVLYGVLFTLLLPLGLIFWAGAVEVSLPTPRWPVLGWLVASLGILMMLEAMRELWVVGGGLPMNAYPPQRLVVSGLYRVVPHPIYVGFCLACLGISVAFGSPGGLWLVTPMVVLGCSALVLGYEGPALRARFPGRLVLPLLRPPDSQPGVPTVRDRASVYLLLFLPWLFLYEAWGHAQPVRWLSPLIAGEEKWSVWEWTTFFYSLAYPFVLGVPLALRQRSELRRFFVVGGVALLFTMLMYVAMPVRFPPRAFDAAAIGGWLLELERADGLDGAVALPSYHVIWTLLSAAAYARLGRGVGIAAWTVAIAICVSCVTTGMHAVSDVVAAIPVAALAWNWPRVWGWSLKRAERVANSWHAVHVGPIRIINYAMYAGLAAALGTLICLLILGPAFGWPLAVVAVLALVGAGFWGQVLAGSRTLLRPFGYFGAILGAVVGLVGVSLLHDPGLCWPLAGALAVSAPWIVVIGRLRCLVQGCCHGAPTQDREGIRYRHPQSRACLIAGLEGVAVHPTPLYSMLSNAVIGVLLMGLWMGNVAYAMIAGVYLLLAGAARFVEESLRGEPMTQIVGGLRIYQWFAAASMVGGAFVTTLASASATTPAAVTPTAATFVWSVLIGVLFAVAMGVDLPGSNRRFSRLV